MTWKKAVAKGQAALAEFARNCRESLPHPVDTLANVVADKLASAAKSVEDALQPRGTVILPGFPRLLQLDGYTCGVQSAMMILEYHGKARSIGWVMRICQADEDGAGERAIVNCLKKTGLRPRKIRLPTLAKLRQALDGMAPVLVSLDSKRRDDDGHWAVVYGYGPGFILVADPALNRAQLCRHSLAWFKSRWRDEPAVRVDGPPPRCRRSTRARK